MLTVVWAGRMDFGKLDFGELGFEESMALVRWVGGQLEKHFLFLDGLLSGGEGVGVDYHWQNHRFVVWENGLL